MMRYVLKELQRHRWRTAASITGYALALFFILIMICITNVNKNDAFGILQSTGTHLILYIPSNTTCCASATGEGSVFAEGVNTQMLDHGMIRTVKQMDGIKDAAPYLLFKMHHSQFGTDISIGGIDTTSAATRTNVCAPTNIIAGKYLTGDPHEIVAEESFATAHLVSVGDSLDLFGGRMMVSGIINSGIRPAKADFYAPIGNVRDILKNRLRCQADGFDMNIILVEVSDARDQDRVIGQLKKALYKFSVSSYNCYEPASKVMTIIGKTSFVLTLFIVIFLIIFSVKTQLSSLVERYREIGILKSLGWSDLRLNIHLILISLIHAVVGASLGILLGSAAILIMQNSHIRIFDLLEFRLQYARIPLLFILALTGGLLASIFPIIRINRTTAGEMIRHYL